ncbi:hypothetical protein F4820DRAFT_463491 [Hypoxylon rubiginosum]|uniref:Uncharacterized protein n=1 Tax=Hypoxylon rubiginosum TaxID=110542 RepID=A0ACB9YTP3_9PEZI|nr:hypothetical protein F4820DRAFT_463491 [Hypoxylon rubiginosum]
MAENTGEQGPPVADPYDYRVRVGDGWTLGDGTFDRVRESRKTKRDVPRPSHVDVAFRSMSALSSLQLSRDAPITTTTIDVVTNELWNYLPPQVRDIAAVPSPSGPELWSSDDQQLAEMYDRMNNDPTAHNKQGEYNLYADLKGKQWVFWPIWVEDQWGKDFVVIAWHAYAAPETPNRYDRIGTWVIYDPRRNPEPDQDGKHSPITQRLDRINVRLSQFFKRGKFHISGAAGSYGNCSPMGLNETSSGERCYATIKELLNNLISTTITNEKVDRNHGWPSLSRWVFPYLYRVEMTGIVAWTVMASHGWDARIAIEALEPKLGWEVVVDGQRRMLGPTDLSGPARAPPITDQDYRLDPNAVARPQY